MNALCGEPARIDRGAGSRGAELWGSRAAQRALERADRSTTGCNDVDVFAHECCPDYSGIARRANAMIRSACARLVSGRAHVREIRVADRGETLLRKLLCCMPRRNLLLAGELQNA